MKKRNITKLNTQTKGGASMDVLLSVLTKYDRLPSNPYFPKVGWVEKVLDAYGYLPLLVFVCPATRSKYLGRGNKELFMPLDEPENGLLFARIPKLKSLVTDLWNIGIPSKIIFVVADNSYELYRGPVEGVSLDEKLMDERREQYVKSLTEKLNKYFPQLTEVVSLGIMRVGLAPKSLEIPSNMLEPEVTFQRNVVYAQFYKTKPFIEEKVRKIVKGKVRAYAEQGFLVEAADALLIATEGNEDINSWVLRTKMLQLNGAKFPSIYPYIRKETLEEVERS